MNWNSTLYDKSQTFVFEYGKNLISLIPQEPELRILDAGCGTGDLTQKLSEISTCVIGIDGSKEMIQAAKVKYPHLTFDVMDACHIKWKESFDEYVNGYRPTPLPGGKDGLRKWMTQFFGSDLVQYSPGDQSEIFYNIEETLKNDAFDGTNWVADYRRLRVIAHK